MSKVIFNAIINNFKQHEIFHTWINKYWSIRGFLNCPLPPIHQWKFTNAFATTGTCILVWEVRESLPFFSGGWRRRGSSLLPNVEPHEMLRKQFTAGEAGEGRRHGDSTCTTTPPSLMAKPGSKQASILAAKSMDHCLRWLCIIRKGVRYKPYLFLKPMGLIPPLFQRESRHLRAAHMFCKVYKNRSA